MRLPRLTALGGPARAGSPGPALPKPAFRRDIQGLRAIAVLLVVLDHAGVPFLPGGYVGVDVFFVLSGFLITGLLLAGAQKTGRVSFSDFYVRRARRILPAATLTLVATIVASYLLLNVVRAREAVVDSIWASVFMANVHYANEGTDYFARGQPPSPVQHYWSLSVEEQFYFAWPALVALALFGIPYAAHRLRGRRHRRPAGVDRTARLALLALTLVAAGASFAWSVFLTDRQPTDAYFSTVTRAWELALGALLAIAGASLVRLPRLARSVMGWLGLAAIVVAAVAYTSSTPFPGDAALLPTLGAALVIAAGVARDDDPLGAGGLLARAPLRYVGDRSYAFYLWHWPVLVIAGLYVGEKLSVMTNLLLVAFAFGISICSYALVEDPIRRARWSRRSSWVLVPASVAAVALAAVVALDSIDTKVLRTTEVAHAAPALVTQAQLGGSTATAAQPLPAVVAAVDAARHGAPLPKGLIPAPDRLLAPENLYDFPPGCAPETDEQTTSDVCRLGDSTSAKSIVLVGDSHAQMWMPTLLAMAAKDGWAVIPIVKSGCNPSMWRGQGYPGTSAAAIRQCSAWFTWAMKQARAARPDVVVVTGCCAGAVARTEADTIRGYTTLARAVRPVAKSVIVLGDPEGVDREPVDCLLKHGATTRTCTTTWNPIRFELNNELRALAKQRGWSFMTTRPWFCVGHSCPMVVGRRVVYRDTGHVSRPYAVALTPAFRAMFRQCILDACPT